MRLPWPDEIGRLPAALREPMNRPGARRHWMWILVAGEFERIVGAITLAERDPAGTASRPDGRLDLALLTAWCQSAPPAEALLGAAVAHAATLGIEAIEMQTTLDTPAARWLAAQGFVQCKTHEVWRVPFSSNFERRHAAIERALIRRPIDVRPLDETALPAVRAICAAHGLLTPDRVVLARGDQDGFDPELSFVAGPLSAPTAIVLVRSNGSLAYLEVLARAPGGAAHGPEVGALLHVFFRTAMRREIMETTCVLDAAQAPDTARLLARADAERLERFALFRRDGVAR
ncbi:hypothetical protein K0B96_05615 [Horticoccus luteus]|uniref:N-acetyltransferase domain-containing protein n=1 Tax=Horticoccus luteus TaxID=2862869 RepID=A0A8F9XKW1_9BACT|nr:hypothetical protein [Horticoccus luteus]QYM80093.1 hypothetical protein K0B96_05615 [Horticoccus luteus]